MANNLRKFNTYSDYEAAELVKPAVSLIAATDEVYFDQKDAPISGLTVYYNITDTSQPTPLFKGGGGSGSGSGSGGVLPSAMIIDGTAVEVTNTYQFSTTGEHIVNYSFEDNQIPDNTFKDIFCMKDVEIGSGVTSIGECAFNQCGSLTSVTIGSGVTSIGQMAFDDCTNLISVTCLPTIPPSLPSGSFFNNASGRKIYVPSASVDAYKAAEGWSELAVDIEPIS